MNLACPECSTVYRIDPSRLPEGGVSTRCRNCDTGFRVDPVLAGHAAGEVVTPDRVDLPPESELPAESLTPSRSAVPETPVFGPQDPNVRAKRLARALVSDIKVYNTEKWEESRRRDSLRTDFHDEILKSWEEYVEQVGDSMAKKTPYFRDALIDILAEGQRVF